MKVINIVIEIKDVCVYKIIKKFSFSSALFSGATSLGSFLNADFTFSFPTIYYMSNCITKLYGKEVNKDKLTLIYKDSLQLDKKIFLGKSIMGFIPIIGNIGISIINYLFNFKIGWTLYKILENEKDINVISNEEFLTVFKQSNYNEITKCEKTIKKLPKDLLKKIDNIIIDFIKDNKFDNNEKLLNKLHKIQIFYDTHYINQSDAIYNSNLILNEIDIEKLKKELSILKLKLITLDLLSEAAEVKKVIEEKEKPKIIDLLESISSKVLSIAEDAGLSVTVDVIKRSLRI